MQTLDTKSIHLPDPLQNLLFSYLSSKKQRTWRQGSESQSKAWEGIVVEIKKGQALLYFLVKFAF